MYMSVGTLTGTMELIVMSLSIISVENLRCDIWSVVGVDHDDRIR